MKMTRKNVLDNSRHTETQRGKGERRTDNTPRPEIGQKQREQQQNGEKVKPNNCTKSEQALSLFGLFYLSKNKEGIDMK